MQRSHHANVTAEVDEEIIPMTVVPFEVGGDDSWCRNEDLLELQ